MDKPFHPESFPSNCQRWFKRKAETKRVNARANIIRHYRHHSRLKQAVLVFLTLGASLVGSARAQEAFAGASPATLPTTNDPKEIVRRAMEMDQHNFELARNYTYQERRVLKMLDRHGKQKRQQIETFDWTILYGEPYSRLIEKDDKPLNAKDEHKEQEKADKFIAKRKNESAEERKKRLDKQEKERREDRAFALDIVNAYDFRIGGQEQLAGRDAYVIDATPRQGFHPTQPHADILPKLKGRVWIDKNDYGWAKIQVETIDTISWGFFLVRIHKGSQVTLEQTRVNNEIWLPSRLLVTGGARVALLMNADVDLESDYSKYKKFSTGSRVLPGVTEVEPERRDSVPAK
jgi:hypothetical protein